jgi:hypothetical protein
LPKILADPLDLEAGLGVAGGGFIFRAFARAFRPAQRGDERGGRIHEHTKKILKHTTATESETGTDFFVQVDESNRNVLFILEL